MPGGAHCLSEHKHNQLESPSQASLGGPRHPRASESKPPPAQAIETLVSFVLRAVLFEVRFGIGFRQTVKERGRAIVKAPEAR